LSPVRLDPPGQLVAFRVDDRRQVLDREPVAAQGSVVERRFAFLGYRPEPELWLVRVAELANHHDVERAPEHRSNLAGHHHPAASQPENHRVREPPAQQVLAKQATRFLPVVEPFCAHASRVHRPTPVRLKGCPATPAPLAGAFDERWKAGEAARRSLEDQAGTERTRGTFRASPGALVPLR
jgi:hypothetical protein